jgi:hypothetical protein
MYYINRLKCRQGQLRIKLGQDEYHGCRHEAKCTPADINLTLMTIVFIILL